MKKKNLGCPIADLNQNIHEVNCHIYSLNVSTLNNKATLVLSATTSNFWFKMSSDEADMQNFTTIATSNRVKFSGHW